MYLGRRLLAPLPQTSLAEHVYVAEQSFPNNENKKEEEKKWAGTGVWVPSHLSLRKGPLDPAVRARGSEAGRSRFAFSAIVLTSDLEDCAGVRDAVKTPCQFKAFRVV